MKSQFNDSSGAALVEMALVLPLVLLLIFGAVELGRIAHFAVEVQNAARAGASYGAVNVGNASNSSMVTQAAQNDIPDLSGMVVTPSYGCVCETLTNNTPSFSPSSGTISCQDPSILACTGGSSTVTYNVLSYITVSTQASLNSVFQVHGLPNSYTLNGYSAMRILTN